MNSVLRNLLFALCTTGAMTLASAQTAPDVQTTVHVLEAPSGMVILPSGVGGSVTTAPCRRCALRNFPVTDKSKFFVRDREVTLAELTAAIAGRQDLLLAVGYSVKTGEIVRIRGSFDLPAPITAPARSGARRNR